jgi:hypothetical protein
MTKSGKALLYLRRRRPAYFSRGWQSGNDNPSLPEICGIPIFGAVGISAPDHGNTNAAKRPTASACSGRVVAPRYRGSRR